MVKTPILSNMKNTLKHELVLGYAPADVMAAIAIKEFVEMDAVRVLMAPCEIQGAEGKHLLQSLASEGRMALVLCSSTTWAAIEQSAMWQALTKRNPQYWPTFIHLLWLSDVTPDSLPTPLPDFPRLEWEWSFKALADEVRRKLIEQGWEPPKVARTSSPKKTTSPSPKPEAPSGQGQSISGNHNIQIGGDIRSGRDTKINSK